MALQAGMRLGPYEIVESIGAGGMGEVFRARDTKLNRDVAIKVLPPAFAQDLDRLARFEREAQALAALNHPHIAQIYGVIDDPPALVMEFVDGEDLSIRIARGPIAIEEALPLAIQIAEALECAHERGIVHRDLKPGNVKLTVSGSVKVLDFGLAKANPSMTSGVSLGLENSPTFTSPVMTQLGVILGTAAYMAPEQAKGKAVDRRADVWAFGGVLFEMLTGTRAFAGEDVTDVIASIMRAQPDWTALPAEVPASLRKLLKRCLEKDRANRLDSMAVARYEMQEALAAPESPAALARPRPLWRRALPFAVTALAASALAAVGGWIARPLPAGAIVKFVVPLPEGQSIATAARLQMAISPDARRLAYVANRELFVRSVDSLEPLRVYANDAKLPIGNLAFSPDGETIAFSLGSSIVRVPAVGGGAVTIADGAEGQGATWSGEWLIYIAERKILRLPVAGGAPETLVTLGDDEFALRPQLLPDGRTLLYAVTTGSAVDRWDDASVVAQRIGASTRTTLVTRASEPRYASTGHLLYAQSGILYAAPFDAAALQLTGGAVAVVEGIARGVGLTFGGTAHYVVSDNGAVMYLPGPREATSRARSALILSGAASAVERLKLPPGAYSEPRISPDGRYVAFATDNGKESDVWIYDLKTGGSARRLTFGGAARMPVWTSDSTRVAYQVHRDGVDAIVWQRADGSDVPAPLTKPDAGTSHFPHAWTKDGRLLLDVKRGESYTLMLMEPRGSALAPFGGVESTTLTSPALSPDERWLSYTMRRRGSSSAVFVQPFPATGAYYQLSKSTEDGHHSTWSPDGRTLFYTPGPGPVLTAVPVTTTPFAMGEPTVLNRPFQNQPSQIPRPYDITPDGRFLGIGAFDGTGNVSATSITVVLNWFAELKARVPLK